MKLMFALVLTCSLFGLNASETCNSARDLHWCSFQQSGINTLECMDGHLCFVDDSNHTDGSWACCKDHGGRSKCPSNHPNMCNSKKCGGGTAYCCEVDCDIDEGGFGGNRPCPCIVTDQDDKIQCADGSFCLGDSSDYGSESWQCCNEKGGRVGCPPNHPNLCAAENACGNGTTLCCEKDCGDFGGKLPCVVLDENVGDEADDGVDDDDDAFDDRVISIINNNNNDDDDVDLDANEDDDDDDALYDNEYEDGEDGELE